MSAQRVVLIGCSAKKLESASPARELYQGNLFRLSVKWAESNGFPWAVLSAKYGLVMPETVISPYDRALAELGLEGREAWRKKVGAEIHAAFPNGALFVWLAGEYYLGALRFIPEPSRYEHEEPLRGMGIGMRMSWLKRNTKVPA